VAIARWSSPTDESVSLRGARQRCRRRDRSEKPRRILPRPAGVRTGQVGTLTFDILGTPALSVPCGTTASGLPIGLQIAGPPGADAAVLRLGAAFEHRAG